VDNSLPSIALMYHGILSDPSDIPPDRDAGAELYDVSLDNFKAQMESLKHFKTKNPNRNVMITFDDGEMNNFKNVFPVLKGMGWGAYFFIVAKRVGKKGYMGLNELKQLHDAGMTIGSHGLTHEILTNLLDSQMEEELRASKENLEINLKIPIDTLSIPRGFCNDKVIETAYRLGYQKVFISGRPAWLKSTCFSRIPVKSNWSLGRFRMALNGKTPLMEIIGNVLIKILKFLLRESGYSWMRRSLIKIIR